MSSIIGQTPYAAEEEQSSIPRRRSSDKVRRLGNIPLHMAKAVGAKACKDAIQAADKALKEFGNKSTVHGWCSEENPINPSLAALIADEKVRRAFALSILRQDGSVEITTVITMRESA